MTHAGIFKIITVRFDVNWNIMLNFAANFSKIIT